MWGKMTQARKNWSNKKDFRYHCSCERFSIKKKEKLQGKQEENYMAHIFKQ